MERLRRHFERNPAPIGDEQKWPVLFSYGVSGIEEESLTSPGLLLKEADARLYAQKAERHRLGAARRSPARPAPDAGDMADGPGGHQVH